MKLSLPVAPGKYDPGNEGQTRALIEQADALNVKTNSVLLSFKMRDQSSGAIKTVTLVSGALVIS